MPKRITEPYIALEREISSELDSLEHFLSILKEKIMLNRYSIISFLIIEK
jgi:hypothetical protein